MEHRPGASESVFFRKIIKYKQYICVFVRVYHWDKQVIDLFRNFRHLNKSARKTTGESILYHNGSIFNFSARVISAIKHDDVSS